MRRHIASRRGVLKGGAAFGLSTTLSLDVKAAEPRVIVNDASRLNPTPVTRHWVVAPNEETAFVERLRTELKEAAAAKRPVAVGAARHSMGGQSIPRDGTAISLNIIRVDPDTSKKTFRANAGTRWRDVIAKLDPMGFSPAVMQSNNDFGVASTFSVNAHGWPVPYGPFGSTVQSIRLMLSDGTIVTCSSTENAELFGLAMGGYGLVGIIVDMEVAMVANTMLKPTFEVMRGIEFAGKFVSAIEGGSGVAMAYGRLNIARQGFFDQALMVTARPQPAPATGIPLAGHGNFISSISREIYRAQVGSEPAKRTRWFLETSVGPKASSGLVTRNTLLNEPVANLASRDRRRTDILHEYFLPPERFPEFLVACKEVILKSKQEFLNVTLRYVTADPTSVLAFAPNRRIAAVMSFSQEVTPEAEADMLRMTEALIERVVAIGGSFYLPYRLHARRDQVFAAYPNAPRFIERKIHYDPGRLFRNAMWDSYFAV